MPVLKRRRAPQPQDDEEYPDDEAPRATQNPQSPAWSEEENSGLEGGATNHQQMVKNFVRYALSSEYSRTPMRRPEISAKCLNGNSRAFNHVFEETQLALRSTFGMELVELPGKDRVTLTQKRQAAKSQNQSAGSSAAKTWVLRSVLPTRFREAIAVEAGPSKIPTPENEGAYMGLYSFAVALVTLSGGQLPETKLDRHLKRCNAEQTTPVDRTDKLMARMCKEGYLVKIKETSGGEEVIEYILGPRAKVEMGQKGVADLVKTVYGFEHESPEAQDDLKRRLERSLKVAETNMANTGGQNATQANGEAAPKKGKQKKQKLRGEDATDDDE